MALPGAAPAPGAVAVAGGRVAAVGERSAPFPAEREIDAGDALVLPGAVDAHVHTGSAVEEGVERCTRAAAAGGVTTIVDMPYDAHALVADADAFAAKAEVVARESTSTSRCGGRWRRAGAARRGRRAGGHRGRRLQALDVRDPPGPLPAHPRRPAARRVRAIAAAGSLGAVHPENDEIVRAPVAERARRAAATRWRMRLPPPRRGDRGDRTRLEFAARRRRLHLCHVSVERGVRLARRARAEGVDVTAETCRTTW